MFVTNNYGYYEGYWLLQFLSTYLLILLAILVLCLVAQWKIFEKAGQKGWASLIPFYSEYIQFDAFWGDKRYFWPFLVMVIASMLPVVGWVFAIAVAIMRVILSYKIAKSFGEGVGFTIGLVLLPFVFDMILAFGKYEYQGAPEKSDTEKKIDDKVNNFVKDNFSSAERHPDEPVETDVEKPGYVPKKDVDEPQKADVLLGEEMKYENNSGNDSKDKRA